jgi:hypothetical protein
LLGAWGEVRVLDGTERVDVTIRWAGGTAICPLLCSHYRLILIATSVALPRLGLAIEQDRKRRFLIEPQLARRREPERWSGVFLVK